MSAEMLPLTLVVALIALALFFLLVGFPILVAHTALKEKREKPTRTPKEFGLEFEEHWIPGPAGRLHA